MKDLSFDDLIPRSNEYAKQQARVKSMDLSFDDLIPTEQPKESGFSDKMKERGARFANIAQGANGYGQSPLESAYQVAGNVIGTGADVLGKGLELGYKGFKATAPEYVQRGLTNVENAASAFLSPYAQKYQENLQAYQQINPQAAANFEATREFANLLPLKAPAVRGAISEVAEIPANAVKSAGKSIVNKAGEIVNPAPIYTAEQAKNMARASYKVAEDAGGTLTPEFANKFVESVNKLAPQTEQGLAIAGESPLTKLNERLATIKDKPITLQGAQEIDEGLSTLIDSHVDRITGKLDKQGQQLYDAQTNFRAMINDATDSDLVGGKEGFDAWKQGQKEWSAAIKLGDVERILERAKMMDNEATGIKNGFRTLYMNKSRMADYSKEEKGAIKKAAESGVIGGTLRTLLGSRLMGTGVGTAIGTAAGGPLGAAIGAGVGAAQSGASREAAALMQRARANKVKRTIGKRLDK